MRCVVIRDRLYEFRSTNGHIQNQVIGWCREQFGDICMENDLWDWITVPYGTRFWFREEQDAILFLLRWS